VAPHVAEVKIVRLPGLPPKGDLWDWIRAGRGGAASQEAVAAAARALDMSSAVVTRLIADLESHLGTRLLHRTTRRVSLSAVGETYLNRVRTILQDIDDAHNVASAQTLEPAGVLRILLPPALATGQLFWFHGWQFL